MERTIKGYRVSLTNDLVTIHSPSGDLVKGMAVNANEAVSAFREICERVAKKLNA